MTYLGNHDLAIEAMVQTLIGMAVLVALVILLLQFGDVFLQLLLVAVIDFLQQRGEDPYDGAHSPEPPVASSVQAFA